MMLKEYYKAVRHDLTSFADPTFKYAIGKAFRPLKGMDAPRICGAGYLHASDVPAETLNIGSWPCRLLVVTGVPVVGFDEERPHKGGFLELEVLREAEAWQVFGPNGQEVVEVIERGKRLTPQEANRLHGEWNTRPSAKWVAAWSAARDAGRDAGRDAAVTSAPRAALAAAGPFASVATWMAGRDAALALVVRDLISAEHFKTLYGPWQMIVEGR